MDLYFWRQIFVLLTYVLHSLSMGFTLAFPSVLTPAITSPNSTDIRTTAAHASWIAAVHGTGGLLGALTMAPIMQIFGRKTSQYSRDIALTVGWIVLYYAKDITALYFARIIQGLAAGGIYTGCIVISEYVHPHRRGYFINIAKVTIALGNLCCHTMGNYFTWRQIAIATAIPSFVAMVLAFFWPESPSYLALKGRFPECETSYRWLNGNSVECERQLKILLQSQTVKKPNGFVEMTKAFRKKEFQRAFVVSTVLTLALDLSGKYYFVAYVVQIMKDLLGNNTSATVFTLGMDIFTVLALILSSVVICFVKRRTLLISSGAITVFLMLFISALVYLKTVFTFSKYMLWFTALMIILQCFVVNIGISSVSFAIIGEIFPLEHKGIGACISGLVFSFLYTVILKTVPLLIENTGLHGMFSILSVLAAFCYLVLFKTVPETKDRTLQDIEAEMKGGQNQKEIDKEHERLMRFNDLNGRLPSQ